MISYNRLADYIIKRRHDQYNRGEKISRKVRTPIISTGSLTIGGAGKTPLTIYIAQLLCQQNLSFAILSRGYRRHTKGLHEIVITKDLALEAVKYGDEPVMLKKRFPEFPVIVCEDRYVGVQYIENKYQPRIILLDDGFQHRKLHRDLDVLIFKKDFKGSKATYYPFGDLRDSLKRLKEANFIFLEKGASHETVSFLQEKSHIIFYDFSYTLEGKTRTDNVPFTAFCGIAKPDRFLDSLRTSYLFPDTFISFPDHVDYTPSRIKKLIKTGNTHFITTYKDYVKLPEQFKNDFQIDVFRMDVIPDKPEILITTINNLAK